MADTGAPGFLPLVSGSDQFTPPQAPINGLATALNGALGKLAFNTYDTKAHLDAAPGTVKGQHGSVNADSTAINNGDYIWNGTAWVPRIAEAKVTLTGTPAVSSGAAAAVTWTGLTQLTAGVSGAWSSGAPTRIVLPYAGLWQINWRLTTGGAASAVVRSNLNLNGSAIADSQLNVAGTPGLTDPFINGNYDILTANGSSYIELMVNSNAGGVVLAGTNCWLTAKLIS